MFAVIFRAVAAELDEEYAEAIGRMKTLAFEEYGCLDFFALMEGEDRVAISYWNSQEDILRWKANSEHLLAQSQGKKKWYQSYSVEIVEVKRAYTHSR
ncbi:MAG: antibiotic biosynthesis monooxygenase [Halioglobus sp.]